MKSKLARSTGNPVSAVEDLSGNGNDAAQATGSFKPSLVADEFGALDALDFISIAPFGDGDRMECGTAAVADAGTYFVVAKIDTDSDLGCLVGRGADNDSRAGSMLRANNNNGAVEMIIGDGTTRVSASLNGAYSAGKVVCAIGRWNGSTIDLNVNGTDAVQVAHSLGSLGTNVIRIGGVAENTANDLDGKIGAAGYYNRRLTDREVSTLMPYLLERFAAGGGQFVYINKPLADVSTAFAGLTHDGQDDPITPQDGGNKTYDLRGTIRTVPLINPPSNVTWDGVRTLLDFDGSHGVPSHSNGGVSGGAGICPNMTADLNWNDLYQSNNVPRHGLVIRNITMSDYGFDNMRFHGLGFDVVQCTRQDEVHNITFDRFGITMQRDDAFELDSRPDSVTIQNCYVESFVFISSTNISSFDGSAFTTKVINCLYYALPCRIDGNPNRFGATFKLDGKSPRYILTGNIFAVPGDGVLTGNKLFGSLINNNKVHQNSSNNTICWLGESSFPYPVPSGFTVLTGATAQTTWDNALSAWWDNFAGHRFSFDPPAP